MSDMPFHAGPRLRALCAAATLVLAGAPLSAQAALVVAAGNSTGNQTYSGVGFSFRVNSAITVSQLGVFDSGTRGVTGTAQLWATLFNASTGSVLASVDFTQAASGAFSDFFTFKDIGPITLGVGDYVLAGYGWDASNQQYNTVVGAGNTVSFNPGGSSLISFNHTRYGGGADPRTVMPTNVYGPHAFNAVNMVFNAAQPVPAPATLMLVGLGLLGVGVTRRKTLR